MGFDDSQLIQSMKYENILKDLIPDGEKMGIKNIFVTVLGIDYISKKNSRQFPGRSLIILDSKEKPKDLLPVPSLALCSLC